MDTWSRLLGNSGSSSSSKHADANSPQQRLIRFKKAHDQLQHIWRRNNATAKLTVPPEPVYQCLQSLTSILREEVQTPIPHLCARHVATFKIFLTLAQVSSIYNDEGIVKETLEIFKVLLDSEEGEFVKDKAFADALVGYISSLSTTALDAKTEAEMVEVLFAISAKLRLQPEILPAWFKPGSIETTDTSEAQKNPSSCREDFPLFYLTVDYIHHEGRVGDFARTGLLYLIECAGQSSVLEQWIIESDLASLMASGLGALYSQLSRKLVLDFEQDSTPAIVTISESPRPPTPNDAERTTSPEFKAHLTTFLSHLVFWQDILEHCTSVEVKQSLLDHFKFLFLQQLLYPSLIESSDIDGGSSVAVLTYLRCIIESINHPDLVKLVFQYLLAVPEMQPEDIKVSRPPAMARRRKSENLVSNLAKGQEKPIPDLFNLVDLVLTSLQSQNQQTVTATLRLICVLLRNRHQYDFSLFKIQDAQSQQRYRSLDQQEQDTLMLFSMTEELAGFETLRESYEAHLHDAQYSIECHECSSVLLALPNTSSNEKARNVNFLSIDRSDPLLHALVDLIKSFLANDIETNFALTQVVSTLALCGSLQLAPWLLSSPTAIEKQVDTSTAPEGEQQKASASLRPPEIHSSTVGEVQKFPPVLGALDNLTKQVEALRKEIQNFDIFLSERKHVFLVGEEIEHAATSDEPRSRRSVDLSAKLPPRTKGAPQIGSIPQRLLSQQSSVQSSRASSPRGRQTDPLSIPAPAGRHSHIHIPPSPSSPPSDSRAFSPSPLRRGPVSGTPPQRTSTPMGPADALRQKVKVRLPLGKAPNKRDLLGSSETSSLRSESIHPDQGEESQYTEVSLSQVLTNVVILQEFMLELAATIQVRASLLGEVDFD